MNVVPTSPLKVPPLRHALRTPLLAILLAAPALAADPAPPPTLAYQGRLLEGAAPVTGDRSFTFTILDAAGSPVWHSGPQTLAVNVGLYSAVLGSAGMPPMPAEILGRAGLKLHVTLSGLALTPDVDIIPGFQARSAWEVTGAFAGDLTGTQGQTQVTGLQGYPLDLTTAAPVPGQSLVFDGTRWAPSSLAGIAGPSGAQGPEGPAGTAGPTGLQGPIGLTGVAGPTGAQGPIGPTGATGPAGTQGPIGLTGATGPVGPQGSIGLPGATGSVGPQGPIGLTGATGSVGAQGPVGLTGPAGPAGATGAAGPQGAAGLTGAMGPQGPIGLTGSAGPAGPAGATGLQGPAGPAGATGAPGSIGPQGLTGPAGATGATGPQGIQGPAGPAGSSGGGSSATRSPLQIATLAWYGANTTFPAIAVGSHPVALAFDGRSMWVGNYSSNNVTRILTATGAVLGTYAIPGNCPTGVAFDGVNVWVCSLLGSATTNLTKFSGVDGTVLGSYKIGTDNAFAVAFDGTVLWVASIDGYVYRVDVSNGSQLGAYLVGQGPISMAFDGTSIWTANSNDITVTRINVANPAIVATYTVGSMDQDWENGAFPVAVAFDGSNIWVSLLGSGSVPSSVKKLNVADGTVAATCTGINTPTSMAFDGVHLWVASGNTMGKIKVADASLAATVPAGLGVSGIAFDGVNIWCANNTASGTVSRR